MFEIGEMIMDDPASWHPMIYVLLTVLVIIIIYSLFKILEFFLPISIRLSIRIFRKGRREFNHYFPKLWSVIKGAVDREDKVMKQEVHHHYTPQYDQSKKTQHITDSVYLSREVGQRTNGFISRCSGCGNEVQSGWKVCPVCTRPIGDP